MIVTNGVNSIGFPLSCFDIKVSDYIDYQKSVERYNAERKKDLSLDNFAEEKATIIEAISFLCKGIENLPFDRTGVNESNTIYNRMSKYADFSIVGLFFHIQNAIDSYEVDSRIVSRKEYSFEHKGDYYFLNGGAMFTNTLSTIETLEIERVQIESTKQQGDEDGSKLFTKLIRTCAILCRKKGENIPLGKRERERFIDERTNLFQDITLNIQKDISFFLFGSILRLVKINDTSISLKDYQATQVLTKTAKPTKTQFKGKKQLVKI